MNHETDDLLRDASNNYPLRTDSSDWDIVMQQLELSGSTNTLRGRRFSRANRKRYALLLIGCFFIVPLILTNKSVKNIYTVQTIADNDENEISSSIIEDNEKVSEVFQRNIIPVAKGTNEDTDLANVSIPFLANDINNIPYVNSHDFIEPIKINYIASDLSPKIVVPAITKTKLLTTYQNPLLASNKLADKELFQTNEMVNDEVVPDENYEAPSIAAITKPQAKSDLKKTMNIESEPVQVKLHKTKRFYLAAMISPDITVVKLQRPQNIGLNFTGLVGFQINKTISIESGLAIGKKYYYSSGRFFDSANTHLRNHPSIVNADGYGKITEIPLNIRFNIANVKSNMFFAGIGTESYIIHEEQYSYTLDKNGRTYKGNAAYKKYSTSFFANIQLSAGVEHTMGNFCELRIEPYYRLPIKGIGVGQLPITSVGVNVGISKKIF
jgi:hypothetical protein